MNEYSWVCAEIKTFSRVFWWTSNVSSLCTWFHSSHTDSVCSDMSTAVPGNAQYSHWSIWAQIHQTHAMCRHWGNKYMIYSAPYSMVIVGWNFNTFLTSPYLQRHWRLSCQLKLLPPPATKYQSVSLPCLVTVIGMHWVWFLTGFGTTGTF